MKKLICSLVVATAFAAIPSAVRAADAAAPAAAEKKEAFGRLSIEEVDAMIAK